MAGLEQLAEQLLKQPRGEVGAPDAEIDRRRLDVRSVARRHQAQAGEVGEHDLAGRVLGNSRVEFGEPPVNAGGASSAVSAAATAGKASSHESAAVPSGTTPSRTRARSCGKASPRSSAGEAPST